MTQRSRKKGNIEIWLHSQPDVCHAHFVLGIYKKPLEIKFKIFICQWNLLRETGVYKNHICFLLLELLPLVNSNFVWGISGKKHKRLSSENCIGKKN